MREFKASVVVPTGRVASMALLCAVLASLSACGLKGALVAPATRGVGRGFRGRSVGGGIPMTPLPGAPEVAYRATHCISRASR